jgi:hypothetical protein
MGVFLLFGPPVAPDSDVGPPAVPAPPELQDAKSEGVAESDIGTAKGLALLALSPLLGLAYVVFLPFIGFGVLLAVVGRAAAQKLGWVQK